MKSPKAKLIAGAVVAAIVVTFQVIAFMKRDDPETEPKGPAKPVLTATTPPAPSTDGPVEQSPTDVVFDESVLPLVAAAMSTWSWEDPHAHSWVDRFAPYATRDYATSLKENYALTPIEENNWRTSVVKPRGVSRVSDVRYERIGGEEDEYGYTYYRLDYRIEALYARPGKAPSFMGAKAGKWVKYADVSFQFGFVVEDGEWRVRDVTALAPGAPLAEHKH